MSNIQILLVMQTNHFKLGATNVLLKWERIFNKNIKKNMMLWLKIMRKLKISLKRRWKNISINR